MTTLREGATGSDVKALQKQLLAIGYSTLQDNGRFDLKTDQAVRTFQTKQGLLPDGIVGKKTREALDKAQDKPNTVGAFLPHLLGILSAPVMYAALIARNRSPYRTRGAFPAVSFKTSEIGIRFIYREEAQKGVSNVLHWPTGDASGVTLGPGYDMGDRSPEEIIAHLTAIGIPQEAAAEAAKGAERKGEKAKEFVEKFNKANPKLINLNPPQERALLEHVLPNYEKVVKKSIHVKIYQHQFDALVSYAYNVGSINVTAGYINSGQMSDAIKVMQKVTTSGGKESKVLVGRRRREVALYRDGDYAAPPAIG